MKSLRGDLVSLASVFALAAAVAAAFPFEAVGFRARRPPQPGRAGAAFVHLRADEEAAALRAAKNAWNAEAVGVRRLRAELFFGELPEVPSEPALPVEIRTGLSMPPPVSPGRTAYPPSLAAPPPASIKPEKGGETKDAKPAFPRSELLKMDI